MCRGKETSGWKGVALRPLQNGALFSQLVMAARMVLPSVPRRAFCIYLCVCTEV